MKKENKKEERFIVLKRECEVRIINLKVFESNLTVRNLTHLTNGYDLIGFATLDN